MSEEKIGIPEFVGEISDSISFLGAVWNLWFDLAKWLNSEIADVPEAPDPFMALLNNIHATLSAIDDDVLASWVTGREENLAFVLAHSTSAKQTAIAFAQSGAARSDAEWAPKLALALRDSFVAVETFTGGLEEGFWLRPDSVKAISLEGDPTSLFTGWLPHIPDRAEHHSFNRVWDYRWALPVALYCIRARLIVLRVAGENNEIIRQEINRYDNFVAIVTKKMESGVRSVPSLTQEQINRIATLGVPIAVADIYGGYYLGGISDPISLKPYEPKAKEIPFPPGVTVGTGDFGVILDAKNKFENQWKNIVKQRIGIGGLFEFSGQLENLLKLLEEQPVTLSALHDIGIDFSVPEADLLGWLNDPDFTPYPAISEALMKLLGNKHLRKPVFLDVIVSKYEETPGVSSPRKLSDVDLSILSKAVVDGYNERYGENVKDFQSLLS